MKIAIESTTKIVTLSAESRGRIAYEAYRDHSDGQSLVTGQPIPGWPELPPAIREAWEAAVAAVAEVPARIWEGHTEAGVPVHCYVTRIAVELGADCSQFERELQEHRTPSAEIQAIPSRLIL